MVHPLLHNHVFIFLLIVPVISTIFVFYVSNLICKHKWKAIHFAVEWTAIFYIIAVILLLEKLLEQTVIGIVLIILITVLSIILILQWKNHTEVVLRNGIKVLTRISFLVFGLIYFLLISYEIIQAMYINYFN